LLATKGELGREPEKEDKTGFPTITLV
jgi:hypothetical protein